MTLPLRRTRLRRAAALAAMLAVVGGLVAVRSAIAPPAGNALAGPGRSLAVPSGGSSSGSSSGPSSGSSSAGGAGTSKHHRHAAAHVAAPTVQRLTGQAYDVGYGVVQVTVTMQGSRITDVRAVSLPQGGRSGDISAYAAPQLRREAISRQSARIDSVSGASYTSAGYARSLQSALDKGASS